MTPSHEHRSDDLHEPTKIPLNTKPILIYYSPWWFARFADEPQPRLLWGLGPDREVTRGGHLTSGILGTTNLMHVLDSIGRSDLAWRLATCTTYPSWGQMVRRRTTLSEAWGCTWGTNNHIMYGSVDTWFYGTLGGIRADESKDDPDRLVLTPYFDAGLSHCRAVRDLAGGRVRSEWRKHPGRTEWEIDIPANAAARVIVPVADAARISEGGRAIREGIPGIRDVNEEAGRVSFAVGSGRYRLAIADGTGSR